MMLRGVKITFTEGFYSVYIINPRRRFGIKSRLNLFLCTVHLDTNFLRSPTDALIY
jgi:hypothetical protein